jgi:hypothetical protein
MFNRAMIALKNNTVSTEETSNDLNHVVDCIIMNGVSEYNTKKR